MNPSPPSSYSCSGGHCTTCSDEGVPMTVLRIEHASGLAVCADEHGDRHTVETALIEPVATGAAVLVHADVAIAALPGWPA